jgi:GNAT superfamily N-acetyltransferase
MTTIRDLVRLVDAHAHAIALLSAAEERVGPFSVLLSPEPGLSACTPHPEAPVDPGDVSEALGAIRERFAARGEEARIELSLLGWPTLPKAIEDAGFRLAEQAPLVVATPDWLSPKSGPATVSLVGPTDDPAFVAAVMRQGFEVRGAAEPADEALAVRRSLAAGVDLALARLDGAPAGSGCASPRAGVAEISTVSTLPLLRRRGIAAQVVSFLAERSVARGAKVLWASPDGLPGMSVATSVGFRDGGVRLAFVA